MLDAWAVVALLRDESGATRVEEAVADGALISWINLGEVFYVEARALGETAAAGAVQAVERRVTAELPDTQLVREAARIKAAATVSYAGAFAVATAERHRLPLLTGDPEILALDRPVRVADLRE